MPRRRTVRPGVGSSVVLKWDGGNWNHKYDVYIGLSPTLTAADKIASNIMVGSPYTGRQESWTMPATAGLKPGTTYYWRVVGKTMADVPGPPRPGSIWRSPVRSGASPPQESAGGGTTATPFPGPDPVLPAGSRSRTSITVAPASGTSTRRPGTAGTRIARAESVDIGPTTDTGGGHYVGWTKSGEWMQYTVDIPTTGPTR